MKIAGLRSSTEFELYWSQGKMMDLIGLQEGSRDTNLSLWSFKRLILSNLFFMINS